jgi:UDPglucose 6-dehydrogenase
MPTPLASRPPRIAVVGLWHLGCVTAACLAGDRWPVLALDPDRDIVAGLRANRPPLYEPVSPN